MKKFLTGAAALMMFFLAANDVSAQIVVKVRPPRPRVVVTHRPPAPSRGHIWVEEDWVPSGRGYRWHGGYWVAPPRHGARWIPGRWVTRRGGQVWISGHWR